MPEQIPVPSAVKKAARHLTRMGGHVVPLCTRDGKTVYICEFDEEVTIGLPEVYLWDGQNVETVFGEEAFVFFPENKD